LISINVPQIDENEVKAVTKVLKSGALTHGTGAGPMVLEFEKSFAGYVKAKHAVAVNSGTAALHASLAVAGIKARDEVIVPSFTFVATAEVVAMVGAKPVFVDIDPETYDIDPRLIEKALTKRTKAIIPVDLYGLPANVPDIREIADKHDLMIIEDAAQAHGAICNGKPAGSFADVACWSFYASKNMTTGEGGMVTTDDDLFADKVRWLRSHGERVKYESLMLGHNYRMPEIGAAIGIAQLKKLPRFVSKRRRNAKRFAEKLSKNNDLQLPMEPKGFKSSYYLYTVRLKGARKERRDTLIAELKKKGISAEVYYANPIHMMAYYARFGKFSLPETERASKQVFSLPVHPGVTPKQLDLVAETVLDLLK
jgi:perosamine synthetase